MKKSLILSGFISLLAAGTALAQLPANPWDTSEFDAAVAATATTSSTEENAAADVGHITREPENRVNIPSIKYNPTNADAADPVYRPAVSSAATMAAPTDSSEQKAARAPAAGTNWQGSGRNGELDYTGAVTTYGRAYGQEMLAPEVNTHNMNVMVQHLRDLGYKIPASYDNKFRNFTKDYAKNLREAYDGLGRQNNPFDTMFSGFLDVVEDQSGLDMENVLFNSFDLMSNF